MIEFVLVTRGLCTAVFFWFPGWRRSRVLDVPKGTITLLFTDIEGSTLLLQQLGEQYSRVLAECRQLLRTAFQRFEGYEVDTQGDACFFAFARATDAVSAAVAAQRALASHAWPEGAAVRVRVGLHTGEPQPTADGYVGLDVHLAARLMSVGHGGQVLLSQTTRHLVEHTLPDGVSLRDLGEHRLKDLQQQSHLFQLVIAGQTGDFPPLKTPDTHPHNLPIQPTPLIGREREVAAVQQLLQREDVRLLTLTGPGGSGKTRLGLHVAAELSDHFTDGIYFVNLAPISDAELVVPTIAQTLGVKESVTRSMVEQLQAFLLAKSLLRQTESEAEEPRLVILETIREYGREALEASGEAEVTHQAHATYSLALAEEAERAWNGPQQAGWLARLEQEHDNLRAAMNWLLERGEAERALRLGTALWWFWYTQEHMNEGWNELSRALERSEGVAVQLRARALWAAGSLAGSLGHVERGEVLCKESLALFRGIGDTKGMGDATFHLAHVAFARWDLAAARSLFEESLVFLREAGDKTLTAWALNALALVILYQGEYARVHPLAEQAVEILRELGDTTGVAMALMTLAQVVFWQGNLARAQTLAEEVLARASETGITSVEALALALQGEITLAQGEATTAHLLIEQSHTLWQEVGNQGMLAGTRSLLGRVLAAQGDHTAARTVYEESLLRGLAVVNITPTLADLAVVATAQGETTWATRLLAAAAALRDSLGAPLPAVYRADYERSVAAAQAQLGEQAFAVVWAEGRGMTWEQALAARGPVTIPRETHPAPPAKSPATYPDGLTAREVEVLRLLAQGLTDAQIAAQLIISPRTVNTHLKAIYGKIQVSSRSAATRYALEQHLS